MQNAAITLRSLGSAFDDDTGRWAISHPLSSLLEKAAPAGQIYPPPSARPFFKGLLYWHAKTQSAREISIV